MLDGPASKPGGAVGRFGLASANKHYQGTKTMSIQHVVVNASVAARLCRAARPFWARGLFLLAVVASFILSPVPARSQPSGTLQEAPSVVQPSVKLVIGGETIKKNSKGTLSVVGNSLKFATQKGTMEVNASSILDVSTNEDSRQNITGAAKVATMAIPYGGSRVLSLFSHGVDVLTLEFTDANGGYHAVIFELPSQRQAAPFKKQLVAMGAKTSVPLEEPAPGKSEKKP
jgi:hypothetical protein